MMACWLFRSLLSEYLNTKNIVAVDFLLASLLIICLLFVYRSIVDTSSIIISITFLFGYLFFQIKCDYCVCVRVCMLILKHCASFSTCFHNRLANGKILCEIGIALVESKDVFLFHKKKAH